MQWAEDVECRSGPGEKVLALVPWPAHQVGHDGQRQGGRKIGHAIDLGFDKGGIDDLRRLLGDAVADGTQSARQHAMGHEFATPAVLGAVTPQRRAAG